MLKTLAAVRTVFLVFIMAVALRAMPSYFTPARTFDETYSRCVEAQGGLTRAVWYAIGWIALETALGWLLALRKPRAPAVPAPTPGAPGT